MFKWISETVVRFPWLYILVFLLVTAFFGSFVPKAEIDPELENDLPLDFPSRVSMDMIEDIFGGNEMIMILLTADDVLNPDTLRRTKEISKRMEHLNHVDRVLSLFELKYIRGQEGEMLEGIIRATFRPPGRPPRQSGQQALRRCRGVSCRSGKRSANHRRGHPSQTASARLAQAPPKRTQLSSSGACGVSSVRRGDARDQ